MKWLSETQTENEYAEFYFFAKYMSIIFRFCLVIMLINIHNKKEKNNEEEVIIKKKNWHLIILIYWL